MDEVQAENYVDPFVQFNWRQLAAASWRSHMKHGRGALVIGWDAVRNWAEGNAFSSHQMYATDAGTVPQIAALIQQYDPAHQAVIVFAPQELHGAPGTDILPKPAESLLVKQGSPVLAWTFEHLPTPPDAHQAQAQ